MDQFNLCLPDGVSITCLEDFGQLKVNELKCILAKYNSKVSGVKTDLILHLYAIFCRFKWEEHPKFSDLFYLHFSKSLNKLER